MYDAPGVGLAAIQIAVAKRIVVADATRGDEPKNPHVLHQSGDRLGVRGTQRLSGRLPLGSRLFRGCRAPGARARALSRPRRRDAARSRPTALLATVLQHEIDHLEGGLFIDHLSRLKRERVVKKFAKAAARDAPPRPSRTRSRRDPDHARRLHGHARFRRAAARENRRRRPRGRGRLHARAGAGRARHGAEALARASLGREPVDSRLHAQELQERGDDPRLRRASTPMSRWSPPMG